jgi:hypothetical protein
MRPSQVAVQSGDPYFHEVLYREMVALGLGTELLQLDANASYLETYLLRAGGLDAHSPGLPLGPLSPEQLTHLDLLAKFYVTRANFSSAAQVRGAPFLSRLRHHILSYFSV